MKFFQSICMSPLYALRVLREHDLSDKALRSVCMAPSLTLDRHALWRFLELYMAPQAETSIDGDTVLNSATDKRMNKSTYRGPISLMITLRCKIKDQ